jgi:hypothetical protein
LRRPELVVALYALLALTLINVFPHFASPNEFTRWALAAAIVEDHAVEVTRFVPILGGNFEDLSEHDGHLYSNKAPGAALVGLPGFAIAHLFTRAMRPTLYAMRVMAATLPAILLALAFIFAARRLGAPEERTTTALVALLFGTPLFAYGMLNFSHALAAAALFGAWVLLFVTRNELAAGALLGLAVFSEYPCAVAALVLIACAPWRSWWKIAAGGLPFAIALAVYNQLAFGSWTALSSAHERYGQFRAMAARGVFGIGMPDPLTLLRLLFDPARGLFVFSPVLVLALVAFRRSRAAAWPLHSRGSWALLLVPLALLLLYSGYPNWHGGWTVGARYLVPALPFLALLLAFGAATALESFLLGASVAAVVLTSLVFPFVPPDFPAPWGTFAIPLLRDGLVAPNLFHLVARPVALIVPFAIVIAATARKSPAMLAGAAVAIAIAILVPLGARQRIERAYIEQIFFERDGAIRREAGNEIGVPPELLRRSDEQRTMPPPSWPY